MFKKRQIVTGIILSTLLFIISACKPISTSLDDVDQNTGYLTLEDGRLIEYKILIPKSWIAMEKVEFRKDSNINYFDYSVNPKHVIFSITALTDTQWKGMQQEAGHGEKLISKDGITMIYNIATDNPYIGTQAEDFQKMVNAAQGVLKSLSMSIISTSADIEEARLTLVTFIDQLSAGDYEAAAKLYGGTYENLIDMNPGTDPGDHATLLEQACTMNGFKCLKIKDMVQAEQTWPDLYLFTLEFSNPDGGLFVLYDCCGPSGLEKPIQSRFEFRVARVPQLGNIFLVQTLPVYTP